MTLTIVGHKTSAAGSVLPIYETTCKVCGAPMQTTRSIPIACYACHQAAAAERRNTERHEVIAAPPPDGMTRQAPLTPGVYRLLYYHPLYQEGRDYDAYPVNKDIRAGLIDRDAFRKVR